MKLNARQRRLWQYSIIQLKKYFNPGVPVVVRAVKLKGCEADCTGIMKLGRMVQIRIRINKARDFGMKYDSLMHEWAHAMEWEANWTNDSPKREHGETWGVWYAKIYRHLIDDCEAEMRKRGLLHKEA